MNVSLYQAASALNAMDRWQETIAENLAASTVPGFKKQDFSIRGTHAGNIYPHPGATSDAVAQISLPNGQGHTNFQPGVIRPTGVKTDVAIEGAAFFAAQLPDGNVGYTRNGEFHITAQGQLVTNRGYPVLSDGGLIQLESNNPAPLAISATGEVSQGATKKGKLQLTEFSDTKQLVPAGGGFFVASDGQQGSASQASSVRQGYLEAGNASAVTEMVNLISAVRAYETNQRMAQIADERVSHTIREMSPQA